MKSVRLFKTVGVVTLGLLVFGNTGCKPDKGCTDPSATNFDANADEDDGSCVYEAGTSATDLLAKSETAAPTIDGVVDAAWASCQKLITTAVVPDPGQDVFRGYVGDSYPVTMRAMYDATNIYFLAEWDDAREDRNRQTWYFDPADDTWKQEDRVPLFDGSGNETRQAFYEDKFALLFNVNNSVQNWNSLSCYATCHTGLSAGDGFARHYTGGPTEFIDMWHWKYVRTNVNEQADDQYQNSDYPNGRHGDTKISGGYTNNKQTLNNGVADVDVPLYFIPAMTYYSWITQAQIDGGTAKMITGVDVNGVLTYDGGTIDPNTDTDFQRDGATTGAKCIPSIYTEAFVGSRGDLTAVGMYTGSGWVLEMSRALNTNDPDNQDVDFSGLEDHGFGLGVFDNAGIAHAIKPNLTLKFEQ